MFKAFFGSRRVGMYLGAMSIGSGLGLFMRKVMGTEFTSSMYPLAIINLIGGFTLLWLISNNRK